MLETSASLRATLLLIRIHVLDSSDLFDDATTRRSGPSWSASAVSSANNVYWVGPRRALCRRPPVRRSRQGPGPSLARHVTSLREPPGRRRPPSSRARRRLSEMKPKPD